MEKKLFSLILERIAADEELRKKIGTIDDAGFEALLKENGVEDIPAGERAKLLCALKSRFDEESELTDDAIDNASGGRECGGGGGGGRGSCCL